MTTAQQELIRTDFERYIKYVSATQKIFNFESFLTFSSTLVNFYIGSSLLNNSEKDDAALFLVNLYNKGMGNRISAEDIKHLALLIAEDSQIDYTIIQAIFN